MSALPEDIRTLIDAVRSDTGDLPRDDDEEIVNTWPVLEEEAKYGLLWEITQAFDPETEADPVAVMITLMIAFGNILGRGPHQQIGETDHFTNEYVVIAGATSRSRKGTSAGPMRRLFNQIDPDWLNTRVVNGIGSGQGLISQVRDSSEIRKGKDTIDDAGVTDKRLLVFDEEHSSTIKASGQEGSILSETARKFWDGLWKVHNAVKQNPLTATGALVSILGHTTMAEYVATTSEVDKHNGNLNRYIHVCVRRSKQLPFPNRVGEEIVTKLAEKLRKAIAFAKDVEQVKFSDDSKEIWREVYPILTAEFPGMYGALIARSEAHVRRVAMLQALLNGSAVIEPVHLLSALAIWQYSDQSVLHIFGDKTGSADADKILDALRETADGMSKTELFELFGNNPNKQRINRALALLESHGLIARGGSTEPKAGRPPEIWKVTNRGHLRMTVAPYLETARSVSTRLTSQGVNSSNSSVQTVEINSPEVDDDEDF